LKIWLWEGKLFILHLSLLMKFCKFPWKSLGKIRKIHSIRKREPTWELYLHTLKKKRNRWQYSYFFCRMPSQTKTKTQFQIRAPPLRPKALKMQQFQIPRQPMQPKPNTESNRIEPNQFSVSRFDKIIRCGYGRDGDGQHFNIPFWPPNGVRIEGIRKENDGSIRTYNKTYFHIPAESFPRSTRSCSLAFGHGLLPRLSILFFLVLAKIFCCHLDFSM